MGEMFQIIWLLHTNVFMVSISNNIIIIRDNNSFSTLKMTAAEAVKTAVTNSLFQD